MTGTRVMTHDEANAELAGAALDALPPAELRAVLAHAASCPICGPELAELRESAALLAFNVPPVQLNAVRCAPMRQRLVARAAAGRAAAPDDDNDDDAEISAAADDRPMPRLRAVAGGAAPSAVVPAPVVAAAPTATTSATPTAAAPPPAHVADRRDRWGLGWIVAAAAAGAFVAAQAGLVRARNERDAARAEAFATRQDAGARVRAETSALAAQVAERDRLLAQLTGPSVRVVELSAGGSAAAAHRPGARVFWDPASNRWTMFAHDLPAPRAGRTYQLWLVTGREKLSAGTFAPGRDGAALVRAERALPAADALRAIAVTDEPEGGVSQPTGPVVVSGSATTP